MIFVPHWKHTPPQPVTEIALLLLYVMMFVPHWKHTHPRSVTEIAILTFKQVNIVIRLWIRTQKVLASNFAKETGFPDRDVSGFSQSTQTNAVVMPRLIRYRIGPNSFQLLFNSSTIRSYIAWDAVTVIKWTTTYHVVKSAKLISKILYTIQLNEMLKGLRWRIMARKIWGFHGGDYEECRLLRCYAAWLLYEPTFRRNLAPSLQWQESMN
jgi:hypothetical protein